MRDGVGDIQHIDRHKEHGMGYDKIAQIRNLTSLSQLQLPRKHCKTEWSRGQSLEASDT